jgi:c-di-GMP-binding flagellar brake protein YcgR
MNKLPIVIESEIFIRSVEQKNLHARSKILGARHGDFILIEDPICQINERLSAPLEGNVICSFFFEGDIYRFPSRKQRELGGGLTLLEYPTKFQVENVRKFHRIQVNIETHFCIENTLTDAPLVQKRRDEVAKANLVDISEGGCYLIVPSLMHVIQNMFCKLDFILPDDQQVVGLQARVRNVQIMKLRKTTEIGLQFIGPPGELAKIASFCQYCLFFKV